MQKTEKIQFITQGIALEAVEALIDQPGLCPTCRAFGQFTTELASDEIDNMASRQKKDPFRRSGPRLNRIWYEPNKSCWECNNCMIILQELAFQHHYREAAKRNKGL